MNIHSGPRLLILTQAVDTENPYLGFFHRWLEELAPQFSEVRVICLTEGKYALPGNVRVFSLGQPTGEVGRSTLMKKMRYGMRFLFLIWKLRGEYDAVLVHMNQEYILIGGWLWRLLGKRIYMWRNHYQGSWLTDIAASYCTNIFCTSTHSYTAKYPQTVIMPVGVDERMFTCVGGERVEHSVLFFGRIDPTKHPEVLLKALVQSAEAGAPYRATFCGPGEESYVNEVKDRAVQLGLSDTVRFAGAVPHAEAVRLFSANEVYVNCSPSGMYDKTIFEAASCGCIVIASSADYANTADPRLSFPQGDAQALADRLIALWSLSREGKRELIEGIEREAANHSLTTLADRLARAIH